MHPDDLAATRASIVRVMSGKPHLDFRNRYVRKDGGVVYILWSARWSEEEGVRIGCNWIAPEQGAWRLIRIASALTVGVNHINRSMGLPDLYPFVLSDHARHKLAFVHDWLRRGAQGL